ncbi:glucose-1-phosphate thymidylyltransferase [Seinonella peptonophila]|uniref:Glucose-1-phosphate thymidylyltransferase n=1 Tax=Seinonella peptonophila TaxID=112248 RepID=A0A1M4T0A2_9BACL|nr:sugar phosphate nucleotidyltransferase [Seinonella peptonophila]SHE37901.1 glucose-1-phosphate thymidylyltransferase [Seinonella peptonophila]
MNKKIKGLVLCAGKGSRLEPLTYSITKTLIPIGNKAMVQRAVETLIDAGIDEIGLVVREGAEEIRDLLGDGSKWGVSITYIVQQQALGTGHAVQTALPFINGDSVIVYLGDNIIGKNLHDLVSSFQKQDNIDAMVVTKEVANPQDYGVVELRHGHITNIVEKPKQPRSNLALTGIFLFSASTIPFFREIPLSTRGEYEITSVFDKIFANQGIIKAHSLDSWWIDAGNPGRLLEANRMIIDEMLETSDSNIILENDDVVLDNCRIEGPVLIGEGSVIKNSVIGPYTTIGAYTTLTNTQIRNSIIMENSSISDIDSIITNSIIGEEVHIKKRAEEVNLIISNKNTIVI